MPNYAVMQHVVVDLTMCKEIDMSSLICQFVMWRTCRRRFDNILSAGICWQFIKWLILIDFTICKLMDMSLLIWQFVKLCNTSSLFWQFVQRWTCCHWCDNLWRDSHVVDDLTICEGTDMSLLGFKIYKVTNMSSLIWQFVNWWKCVVELNFFKTD